MLADGQILSDFRARRYYAIALHCGLRQALLPPAGDGAHRESRTSVVADDNAAAALASEQGRITGFIYIAVDLIGIHHCQIFSLGSPFTTFIVVNDGGLVIYALATGVLVRPTSVPRRSQGVLADGDGVSAGGPGRLKELAGVPSHENGFAGRVEGLTGRVKGVLRRVQGIPKLPQGLAACVRC